jgi:dephospho-CoA kinase
MADVWVVTGGIGSGKSTVRQVLDDLGAVTIDSDRVGHAVLDGAAFEAVTSRWPSAVVDGRIDRARLGAIVFSDAGALRELESISHPAIAAAIARIVEDAGDAVVVVEVSVPKDLVGAGWQRTIVADLDVEERRERLMARGMDPTEIDRRMASQPSRQGWQARGRWIVSTAGSREQVSSRVKELWEDVIDRSR